MLESGLPSPPRGTLGAAGSVAGEYRDAACSQAGGGVAGFDPEFLLNPANAFADGREENAETLADLLERNVFPQPGGNLTLALGEVNREDGGRTTEDGGRGVESDMVRALLSATRETEKRGRGSEKVGFF